MVVINDCVLRIEYIRKRELDSWQERSMEEVEDITKTNGHHITTDNPLLSFLQFVNTFVLRIKGGCRSKAVFRHTTIKEGGGRKTYRKSVSGENQSLQHTQRDTTVQKG